MSQRLFFTIPKLHFCYASLRLPKFRLNGWKFGDFFPHFPLKFIEIEIFQKFLPFSVFLVYNHGKTLNLFYQLSGNGPCQTKITHKFENKIFKS
jgi:hypothetical protein